MSPTHRSLMAEILSRETRLPVQELTDGELPKPDVIYIIPPGYNLVFKDPILGFFRHGWGSP
jgi:two-component system CheB/CheR fusion protein